MLEKTKQFHLDSRKLAHINCKSFGIIIENKNEVSLNEVKNILKDTNERVYICVSNKDSIFKSIEGNPINIGLEYNNYINPLDIYNGIADFSRQDFLLSILELIIERKLENKELSIICRSLSDIYEAFEEEPSQNNSPILEDLIKKLLVQKNGVSLGLEFKKYIENNLNFLNKKTNIDIFNESRLNIIDISSLDEKAKAISMLVIDNIIRCSISESCSFPKDRLYIEDMHLLLKNMTDCTITSESILDIYFHSALARSNALGHLLIGLTSTINFKYISFLFSFCNDYSPYLYIAKTNTTIKTFISKFIKENNLSFKPLDLKVIYNKTVLIYGFSIYYENKENYYWKLVAKYAKYEKDFLLEN